MTAFQPCAGDLRKPQHETRPPWHCKPGSLPVRIFQSGWRDRLWPPLSVPRSPISPARLHLGDPENGAGVALWDCEAAAITRPDVPGGADWTAAGEGWRVTSHGQGRYLCEERPASLLWLDRRKAQLVGCFANASSLGCADRARPLQRVMSELCRALGIQDIHAALVGKDGRGVLLVGAGGRGKTTASLDALHGGLQFLGDDSVAIGEDEANRLCGYSLYASARVRAPAAFALAFLSWALAVSHATRGKGPSSAPQLYPAAPGHWRADRGHRDPGCGWPGRPD